MIGAELMRDAALLGAACVVTAPRDEVPDAAHSLTARPQEWNELRSRLEAHEASDDAGHARLCDELGMDRTSYCLVMLCCAVERYPEAAAAVSLMTEDPRALLPTPTVVALLVSGLTGDPFAATLAAAIGGGMAARLGLVDIIEQVPGLPHSHHAMRLVRRELMALLEQPRAIGAHRERPIDTIVPPPHPAFDDDTVRRAAALLDRHRLLVLRGPRRSGRQLACDLASLAGSTVNFVTVDGELPRPSELARVRDGLLVVDLHLADPAAEVPFASFNPESGPLLVLVAGTADVPGTATIDVAPIGYPEAARVWGSIVGAEHASGLAARYRVGVEEARRAVREAGDLDTPSDTPPTPVIDVEAVARRIRAQGARRIGQHVTVVETSTTLADLVVPPGLRAQLDEIVGWQREGWRVRWGMDLGRADTIGMGLTCLFAGKPGTGKSFAARCLAAELGLNLYCIDLSRVVSKYIGDTEKALAAVFDEVEAGHGILLFDEADAIFGRRSEVKDAHDRYANIEVGYLLQRLESYEGMAVLTTNLQGNIDAAFVRRLRFILQFPEPDRDLRLQLWERSLPSREWRDDDLDLGVLADRFALNGGSISNIGLAAAHLAAATPAGLVTTAHVLRATQRELQKTGRPSDAAAFGPLGDLVGNGGRR
jgi:hypothetical protein